MTFELLHRVLLLNVVHLHTKYEICRGFPSWDNVFTKFSQSDSCWPPNDLWPPPKTIGFLYSMWYTYIPHMRYVEASLLEILCLQAGHHNTHTHTYTHIHTRHHECKGYDYHPNQKINLCISMNFRRNEKKQDVFKWIFLLKMFLKRKLTVSNHI